MGEEDEFDEFELDALRAEIRKDVFALRFGPSVEFTQDGDAPNTNDDAPNTNDRDAVLAAVTQDGDALRFASEDLKNDREVVLAAATSRGRALELASEDLKNDRDVVLAAVSQLGDALLYASEDLKNDRDFVLAAIIHRGQTEDYQDAFNSRGWA